MTSGNGVRWIVRVVEDYVKVLAEWLLSNRIKATVAIVAVVSSCVLGLRRVEADFSLDPILQASDDDLRKVNEFQERVPPRFYDVVFTLTFPERLAPDDLDLVGEIAESLGARPDVAIVRSLATTPVVAIGSRLPLPQPFPDTVRPGQDVAMEVEAHPLLRGRVISKDGRSTPLFVKFAIPVGDTPTVEMIDLAWREVVSAAGPRVAVRKIGGPIVEHAMSRSMWRDVGRNLTLEVIFCTLLLAFLFRSGRGAALPIIAVVTALFTSTGVLAHLGYSLTLIDLAIPGLVIIIGLCDAVHLLHRFEDSYGITHDRHASIVDMMQRVGAACFHTSLTTSIGFLSLLISRHEAVRTLGIKASISVSVTFLVVVTVVPLLLSVWPITGARPPRIAFQGRFARGHRRLVLVVFGVVLTLSAFGAFRVEADSFWLEELPADAPEVVDMRWYESQFSGLLTIDARLEGELDDPAVFRAIEALTEEMSGYEDIDGSESYTGWVREVLGNPEVLSDEDIKRGVTLLKMTGAHFPRYLIDPTFRHGRLTFRTPDIGTQRFLELAREIDRMGAVEAQALADAEASPVKIGVGGYMLMAHESSRLVVTTLLQSFLLSLVTISVFIAIIYRSVRVGLISVIPNVFPILVAFGVNGFLDIPLRIGIVMIYCLGLGLAVDDTIHLVTRFFQEREADPGGSSKDWIERALRGTGGALIITSAILSVGCLCYLPSEFRSMIDVGTLLNVVVITALLADLFMLPILLEWLYRGASRPSQGTDT